MKFKSFVLCMMVSFVFMFCSVSNAKPVGPTISGFQLGMTEEQFKNVLKQKGWKISNVYRDKNPDKIRYKVDATITNENVVPFDVEVMDVECLKGTVIWIQFSEYYLTYILQQSPPRAGFIKAFCAHYGIPYNRVIDYDNIESIEDDGNLAGRTWKVTDFDTWEMEFGSAFSEVDWITLILLEAKTFHFE